MIYGIVMTLSCLSLALWLGHRMLTKSKVVPLKDMDLSSPEDAGLVEVDPR